MANQRPRASIHATPQTTFAYLQAKENTRDKWGKDKYAVKNQETGHHYDISRKHLNFIVTSDGIKPMTELTAKELHDRYHRRLDELGYKPSESKKAIPQNTYIDWVFGGDHNVMTRLAFGNQQVSYDLKSDNSHIQRMEAIENFAKAVYAFSCKMFGMENVLGVEAHLGETTPHINVNTIPVAMRKTKGRASYIYVNKEGVEITSAQYRNLSKEKRKEYSKTKEIGRTSWPVVSYSGLVGEDQPERSNYLREFHTLFHEQVGRQFGLARGNYRETLPEEEQKKVRHKTSIELEQETRERLENSEKEFREVQMNIVARKDEERKRSKQINYLRDEHKRMARVFDNDIRQTAEREYSHIRGKYYKMLHESSQPLFDNLSREQKNELYNSGFYNLIEGGDKIVNCAFLLSMNIVKEAINYSETHGGGGGGSSLSDWGRKMDDDDERWWRRCIRQASSMMKPRLRRGIGR